MKKELLIVKIVDTLVSLNPENYKIGLEEIQKMDLPKEFVTHLKEMCDQDRLLLGKE